MSPWLYNNHVIKNLKELFKPPLTETYLNFFNNFRCKHNWALQWHLGIACTCMFSINTKCPQMRPHVLSWDHMSSDKTTCPQMRPHVLRWDHVSSVETTCPQLRPRVLSWDHVSSVETPCPQLRPRVLSWDHMSSVETTCPQMRPHVLSWDHVSLVISYLHIFFLWLRVMQVKSFGQKGDKSRTVSWSCPVRYVRLIILTDKEVHSSQDTHYVQPPIV